MDLGAITDKKYDLNEKNKTRDRYDTPHDIPV